MNVLLTSVGRRVKVVQFFKENLEEEDFLFCADLDPTAPALYFADKPLLLEPAGSEKYIRNLIKICKEYEIDLVIPFIDPELEILAAHKNEMIAKCKTLVLISDPEIVKIGSDKLLTWKFFKSNGIPTPNTWTKRDFMVVPNSEFPVILKPRFGSASKGIKICNTKDEVEFYTKKEEEDFIIQEIISGSEITLDVLCDTKSCCLSVVPRKRLKVRAGEVERGMTIESQELIYLSIKIVELLKPVGPINIQCFLTEKGPVFTEINPRFGGGYPLSYYAGANFPKMILDFVSGKQIEPIVGIYERNLLMLRYDDAVVIRENELIS